MAWEVVIGLEIHTQLATESKIFSGAATRHIASTRRLLTELYTSSPCHPMAWRVTRLQIDAAATGSFELQTPCDWLAGPLSRFLHRSYASVL